MPTWAWGLCDPCCAGFLYAISGAVGGRVSKFRTSDGSKVTDLPNHGSGVSAIAVDSEGAVYIGGSPSTGGFPATSASLRKYIPNSSEASGYEQAWHTDIGSVAGIAIDSNFNVVTSVGGGVLKKHDSAGNPVWSQSVGFSGHVAIDPSDNIILSGSGGTAVRKYNSSGTHQWTFTDTADPDSNEQFGQVVSDSSGVLYANGPKNIATGGDEYAYKISAAGSQIARLSHNAFGDITSHVPIGVDPGDGTVVLMSGYQVKKYAADFSTLLWSYAWNPTATTSSSLRPRGIIVANDGSVYVSGGYISSENKSLAKLDSDGVEVWSAPADGSGGLGRLDMAPGMHPVHR